MVPAAGVGARMGAGLPKQYLSLAGRSILARTLDVLASHPQIDTVVVGISADDNHWHESGHDNVFRFPGGSERCHTVLNGLLYIVAEGSADDWVLVHDAVRPLVCTDDISRLIEVARQSSHGALLAQPMNDTVKRADPEGGVVETVDRSSLWRAATPQMFRAGLLKDALVAALEQGFTVTDESSAVEHAGHRPRLVSCSSQNIKITTPADLEYAAYVIQTRKQP